MLSPFDTTSSTNTAAHKGSVKPVVVDQQQQADINDVTKAVDTTVTAAADSNVTVHKQEAGQVHVEAFAETLETSFTTAYKNVFNALSLSYTGIYNKTVSGASYVG
jgi:NAD kinase